jgi:group I intron endonuclease
MIKISGVYEIKNTLNNHRYVGSSVNILKRFMSHKYSLWNGKHRSIKLQRAWDKYGEEHFEFNILETCESIKDTLLFIEQKYLDLKPEYNILYIAGSSLGCICSEETKLKISSSKKGKKPKSRLSEEELKLVRERQSVSALKSNRVKKMRKAIIMLDKLTNEELKEFDSAVQAAIFLGSRNKQTNISSSACKKRDCASGYKWKFKNTKDVV